jgi:hypothetical protein
LLNTRHPTVQTAQTASRLVATFEHARVNLGKKLTKHGSGHKKPATGKPTNLLLNISAWSVKNFNTFFPAGPGKHGPLPSQPVRPENILGPENSFYQNKTAN